MADQLKLVFSTHYLQENPPQSFLLTSPTPFSYAPNSFSHGVRHINAGVSDLKIAENCNIVILTSSSVFEVKIGDGSVPKRVKIFCYDGEPVDVYVSNPNSQPIDINLVTAVV
ncbi:MAG: hypothetical protein QW835_00130 [Candidatus Hadarchaeum sp.]